MDDIEKLLKRVQPKHRDQILAALLCLRNETCRSKLRAEKLSGKKDLYRIHVGRYRIIFRMYGSEINIRRVGLRNEGTYRDL